MKCAKDLIESQGALVCGCAVVVELSFLKGSELLEPNKFLFSPWEAPKEILEKAGIELGKDYPEPIIDLKYSRELALEAFAKTKLE